MKEQKKKRIIIFLLLSACFISGYLLYATSDANYQRLQSLAHVDSLIHQELSNFNISEQQIRISSVTVDSNLKRKRYFIDVPYQFSKTQFHAELNSRLHPYSVKTPAQVTFPQENMDIHLLYNGAVIRTLHLQTDPDLAFSQSKISLLVVFDNIPDGNLVTQLEQLGEPIPIILKITNPMQANELQNKLANRYDRIIFWLQNESGQDLIQADRTAAISRINQLQEVLPEAPILHYNPSEKSSAEDKKYLIGKTKTTFVDASNALMLDNSMGKGTFFEKLDQLQIDNSISIGIISGNETTLSWLSQKLPELKKAGTMIAPPPKTN